MKLEWTISKTPKKWREDHKLTQSEMAKLLSMSRVAYNALEQGKSTPSFETILMMNHIDKIKKDEEKYGDGHTYTTFKIGELYEVEIKEE